MTEICKITCVAIALVLFGCNKPRLHNVFWPSLCEKMKTEKVEKKTKPYSIEGDWEGMGTFFEDGSTSFGVNWVPAEYGTDNTVSTPKSEFIVYYLDRDHCVANPVTVTGFCMYENQGDVGIVHHKIQVFDGENLVLDDIHDWCTANVKDKRGSEECRVFSDEACCPEYVGKERPPWDSAVPCRCEITCERALQKNLPCHFDYENECNFE